MIIHPVRVEVVASRVRVAVPVQYASDALPSTLLWYEFSGIDELAVSKGMDGFLAAILLVAMERGEGVEVRGPVSERFLRGAREYQRVFHAWHPEKYTRVEIRAAAETGASGGGQPLGVGCAFSGGIDSSYTLLSHLPNRESDTEWNISHAIFVHGFDIPLTAESVFTDAAASYREWLKPLGVELITVRTNVRDLLAHIPWEMAHGSALASVPLLLDGLLRRFFIPASFNYDDLGAWGSHPLVDPMLSTSSLEIIHDGVAPRVDKVALVGAWSTARQWLRVCWERPDAFHNCGRCYNCLLTMVSLEISGWLRACPTFPQGLNRPAVRALRLPAGEFPEVRRMIARARANRREDLASDLHAALWGSRRALAVERIRLNVRKLARRLLHRQ